MAPQGKLSQAQVSKAQVAGHKQARAGGRSPRRSGAPPCQASRAEPVLGWWLALQALAGVRGVPRPPPHRYSTCCFRAPRSPDTCRRLAGTARRQPRRAGVHPGHQGQRPRSPVPAPSPTPARLRGRPGFEKRMPVFQNLEETATGWFLSYLCYQKLSKPKKAREAPRAKSLSWSKQLPRDSGSADGSG